LVSDPIRGEYKESPLFSTIVCFEETEKYFYDMVTFLCICYDEDVVDGNFYGGSVVLSRRALF